MSSSTALDCRLATHALLDPRFRVHATDNLRVVSEDLVTFHGFARKGRLSRPCVTVLLEGHARLGDETRTLWLEPGSLALLPAKGSAIMRQESAPHYRAIAFEWDADVLGDRPPLLREERAGGALLEASQALWTAICTRPSGHGAELRTWLAALRPIVTIAPFEIDDEVPARTRDLSAALDRALSDLAGQPMHADLERALGVSAKQVARRVRELNEEYGFNADSWRDTRNRRRLMVALVFLSVEGASLEQIAADVGYRSASALCRAFTDAGFPVPSTVAARVAELGGQRGAQIRAGAGQPGARE